MCVSKKSFSLTHSFSPLMNKLSAKCCDGFYGGSVTESKRDIWELSVVICVLPWVHTVELLDQICRKGWKEWVEDGQLCMHSREKIHRGSDTGLTLKI